MRSAVGKRIMKERKALGISVRKLSRILGVEHTTLSRWESGRHPIPTPHLQAIAAALGVTVARLVGETLVQQQQTPVAS